MNYNKESLEEKARVDRHNENLLALHCWRPK
jgi:hypothetical protein